jgi:hypothetical protein
MPARARLSMSSKEDWKQLWTVNTSTASARHESGLQFFFEIMPILHTRRVSLSFDGWCDLGGCRAPDGREWAVYSHVTPLQAFQRDLLANHGEHQAPLEMSRLVEEAREIWLLHAGRSGVSG